MKSLKPTDSELEILQLLWEQSPQTVREVNEKLSKTRETGYTTTLKIMQIMYEKGLVSRTKSGKTHLYTAAVNEEEAQSQLLDRFIDKVFKGSAARLMMQALGNKKTSEKELKEIREILQKIENQQSPENTDEHGDDR